jgi:AraC-like DNA-binding protein
MDITRHSSAYQIRPAPTGPMVTRVVKCDYSEILKGHYNRPHLHHYHQLDVILEGEFTLTLENQEDQVGHSGDAWIVPPLISHGVDCRAPFRWCSCKFHLSPQFWPLFGTIFTRFHLPEYLRECVDEAGKWNAIPKMTTGEHMATIISLCLLEFIKTHTSPTPLRDELDTFQQALWPILNQIELSPTIQWTVERMAKKIGLSPDHFTRCFRQVIGQTPQQYVVQTAMRNAATNLLRTPPLSIKQIARQAGYASVHSFTHAFTRIFKISPAAYKREHLSRKINS